jgi:hypothetical protein
MSKVRIILGLAVAACAFSTLAAPALARRGRPKALFGDFIASFPNGTPISPSSPATATGIGSVERINIAEGAVNIGNEKCKKIKSTGKVESEKSETFTQVITFTGCTGLTNVGTADNVFEEVRIPKFMIAMEYHANGAVEVGGEEAPTANILHTNIVIQTAKHAHCVVEIPSQSTPFKALKKPENEFEAGAYGTEPAAFHPQKMKKFPKGFQEELDITMEFEKVVANVIPSPTCFVGAGFKDKKGFIEAEIEEVKIKNGNLGFETKAEVEAEGH